MLACILFVFGALVEYAAILFRRQKDEVAEVSRLARTVVLSSSAKSLDSQFNITVHCHGACCRYPTQFIKARLVCTSPENEVPYYIHACENDEYC